MRDKCQTVYTFEELSESAKAKACDWYRQGIELDSDQLLNVDDVTTIAGILGIRINTRTVKLMGGGTRQEPVIYWALDRDQGASFDGWYAYGRQSCKKIREHAPLDTDLHAIADDLQKCQRTAFYQLSARIDAIGRGTPSIRAEVERTDGKEITARQSDIIGESLEGFAHWIAKQVQAEYEYQMSDEQVAENIIANEYEFTEDGKRA